MNEQVQTALLEKFHDTYEATLTEREIAKMSDDGGAQMARKLALNKIYNDSNSVPSLTK